MTSNQLTLFDNEFGKKNEYMVFIPPSEEICTDIKNEKINLLNKIGKFDSVYSPAHLSLFKFKAYEKQVFHQIESLKQSLNRVKKFGIELNNYGFFENSGTIYIDIKNKTPVRNLFYTLINAKADFIPHITIAKKLKHEVFSKLMNDYRSKECNKTFACDRIRVLNKIEGQKHWRHFTDIPFSQS